MTNDLKAFQGFVSGKKVAVLGLGVSNMPLIRMLVSAGAHVTACDRKNAEALGDTYSELKNLGVDFSLGDTYLKNLDHDIIFKTPGMRFDLPELVEARENGSTVTSEMEVFFDLCPATIFAITGSDGKTTTTTLIYEALKTQGYTCHLGGNIGRPLLQDLEKIRPEDMVVVELSSFQLHTMKKSAHVAVVTNVEPNHLDVHKSMEEYVDAKKNAFRYQGKDDILVANADNAVTKEFFGSRNGKGILFSSRTRLDDGVYRENDAIWSSLDGETHKIIDTADIRIMGDHNVENFMAAIAATHGYVDEKTITELAMTFPGVEHRLEFVREIDGVKYYNDSIGTSPTRTTAGLRSFKQKVVLIAGGYDKKLPFDGLGREIALHVKHLILTGATKDKILESVKKTGCDIPIDIADDWEKAVHLSHDVAEEGDIVLFSPACASFDAFPNFAVRGQFFKDIVNSFEGKKEE